MPLNSPPVVLAVSPFENDLTALESIFSYSNWDLQTSRTIGEAAEWLRDNRPTVILCEHDLPGGGWQALLKETGSLDNPPRLLVTSAHADDRLWAEVLNLGGYDVLPIPFNPSEMFRVLSLAWRAWHDGVGAWSPKVARSGASA